MVSRHYIAELVFEDRQFVDILVRFTEGGRERVQHCWGRGGPQREIELAARVPSGCLPVLLGTGLGVCLERLAGQGPVIVVDREAPLLEKTGVRRNWTGRSSVRWLDGSADETVREVRRVAQEAGLSLHVLALPFYLRLDPEYYRVLYQVLRSGPAGSSEEIFSDMESRDEPGADRTGTKSGLLPSWGRYPRFCSRRPRVLVLRKRYFLYDEIATALQRLSVPHVFVDMDEGDKLEPLFVEDLLSTIARFRPDMLLTVNHFGLDREGRLAGLLEQARLPLASWFVDNPQLILHDWPGQRRSNVAVFSFDASSVAGLLEQGYAHAAYLPLATDPERFRPGVAARPEWRSRVSFVGDSLTLRVQSLVEQLGDAPLSGRLFGVGSAFALSRDRTAAEYLERCEPELARRVDALPPALRLAAHSLVTFAAAQQYRVRAVSRLAGFSPLVAGDAHWPQWLGQTGIRFLPRLSYYRDLPGFYGAAEVNFNCTSAQMKGAVNQRVFDVPACGAFLLTDAQDQLADLLEPGREMTVYHDLNDIPGQISRWLGDASARRRMVRRARQRVLAEHTYEHRLARLLEIMREAFAVSA
jgi:spore maturation protein CgeB